MKIIAIESTTEGAGKTTQVEMLTRLLPKARAAKFPSLGARDLILSPEFNNDPVSSAVIAVSQMQTEMPDLIASNQDYLILDRYILSVMAYQGQNLQQARNLTKIFDLIKLPTPDLTIVLDLAPELALSRLKARGEQPRIAERSGRVQEIANRYKDIVNQDWFNNTHLLDASEPIGVVNHKIMSLIERIPNG